MEKFKIGDKVELLGTKGPYDNWDELVEKGECYKGKICVVCSHDAIFIPVQVGGHGQTRYFDPKDLRLVNGDNKQPQIGDKVRLLGTKHGMDYGDDWETYFSGKGRKKGDIVTINSKDGDGKYFFGNATGRFDRQDFELISDSDKDTCNNKEDLNKEVKKMNKPETELERNACKKAIDDVTRDETDKKALQYADEMRSFITLETQARSYRKQADEKRELLGLTKEQIKELF